MAVNQASIRLITEFEGFVPNWYPDPAHGWAVPTVGYGHTDAAGAPLYADTKNKTFSKSEAIEMLRRDLGQYEEAVNKNVRVPLNQNQYGALVSFTYNLGAANLAKSTLVKKLNAGDYAGAAKEFQKWNKAGGKVLAGLTRRRESERQLFLSAVREDDANKIPPPPDMPIPIDPAVMPEKKSNAVAVIAAAIILIVAAGAAVILGGFGG